ncbi:MAG: phosphoglycerate mutase [Betaproteobacteria bacterium HGW-Betaproteobacteria-11]|nr:MAG: phosphoglycerate mutase [Betaproteobacteria bacterium HGW-Betaproteobacteria-11]
MQLFLIRHPPPRVAAGLCYGATDLVLAEDPRPWVGQLAAQLPPAVPLFTSPLQRCLLPARQLQPQAVADARLREMDFGAWEMQSWDAIDRASLDAWAADPLGFAPPEGESVATLKDRVLDFLAELRAAGIATAALMTHAGVMKVIVGHARRLPHDAWMQLAFACGDVVSVGLDP